MSYYGGYSEFAPSTTSREVTSPRWGWGPPREWEEDDRDPREDTEEYEEWLYQQELEHEEFALREAIREVEDEYFADQVDTTPLDYSSIPGTPE